MMSLIGFVIALGILVTVHEWGHYRVAVACRIRVLKFSIGFGHPLWRWVRTQPHLGTETEFVIGSIPLGGYVKLLDMRDDDAVYGQENMAFDRQPLKSRAAVVFAGPLANFVLAFLLYAFTFAMGSWQVLPSLSVPVADSVADRAGIRGGEIVRAVGVQSDDMQEVASLEELRDWFMLRASDQSLYLALSDSSGQMRREVMLSPSLSQNPTESFLSLDALGLTMPQLAPVLRDLTPDGAAQRAGLEKGDRVISVDGQCVMDAAQLKRMVRQHGENAQPQEQIWRVIRGDEPMEFEVVLDVVSQDGRSVGRLGAWLGEPAPKVWVDCDLVDAVIKGAEKTVTMTVLTLKAIVQMISGVVSWSNLGGPIAIADMAGQSLQLGLHAFLVYIALLSVSLGVFNLLPIPALDGGHLLYYFYEFLMGRAPARRWVLVFQQAGFWALVALTAVALFNDLHRLGG